MSGSALMVCIKPLCFHPFGNQVFRGFGACCSGVHEPIGKCTAANAYLGEIVEAGIQCSVNARLSTANPAFQANAVVSSYWPCDHEAVQIGHLTPQYVERQPGSEVSVKRTPGGRAAIAVRSRPNRAARASICRTRKRTSTVAPS